MRYHCRENFSALEKTVRQGHFGQKQIFRQKPDLGSRFCRTTQAYNLIFLSSLKDSTSVYSMTQKRTWDG